jgi:hypothetical protein
MRRLAGFLFWAARDLRRQPFAVLLTGAALALLVGLVGALVLASHALAKTAEQLLAEGPALVVRRLQGGGFDAMPSEAAARLAHVTGVTGLFRRTFGTVSSPDGPLTVHGSAALTATGQTGRPLGDQEVVLGPGVNGARGDTIALEGAVALTLRVVGKLPASTGMVTHDTILTTERTARALLGIPEGYVSDIALSVYHQAEAEALVPDIAKVLPFPVHITTRREAIEREATFYARRSGLGFLLVVPAIMGLALIIAGTVRERLAVRGEVGLLKALGWTTADVATFHLLRAIVIGVPAVLVGTTAAVASVALPGVTWPLAVLGDWGSLSPPPLSLTLEGGLTALAVIACGVLVPWTAAAVVPILAKSAEDPAEHMRGG